MEATRHDTYWQPPRHPRAGIAIGAAILVAWLGALGVALTTDDTPDGNGGATPAAQSSSAQHPGR